MPISKDFQKHLDSGLTTLARCWSITRADGTTFGFTDHDLDLSFEGITFQAGTGLTASALQQGTGLSVDNTEALGALSDAAVTEADIEAGWFDGAGIVAWLTNWQDVSQRIIQFRGSIGELTRTGGAFQAELRGLTEVLNRPLGRVYQKPCTAVLGDKACRFDTSGTVYSSSRKVVTVEDRQAFRWVGISSHEVGWFTRGRLEVLSGPAKGLSGTIKRDRFDGNERVIELWEPIRADIGAGDDVLLIAGCDKRFDTCRYKFSNVLNFQGFPDLPGDDWLASVPRDSNPNTGGSLRL